MFCYVFLRNTQIQQNLINEKPGMDHIKWSRGQQVPQSVLNL